jgi:hypothetical protein
VAELAQIVFRVRDAKTRKEFEDRADALIPTLEGADPDGRRVTRSDVYRRAMRLGLQQLEKANPKPKRKAK